VDALDLAAYVRDVPDFPSPGVMFKDIAPLLGDPEAFASAVDQMVGLLGEQRVDKVLGVEARGFILAAPLALRLGAGFVPVRKADKLPWETHRQAYDLEYGSATLEVHRDAVAVGERVLVVDDVLATGGTAAATALLVDALGATVIGFSFLIELGFLGGRQALGDHRVDSVLTY